VGGNVDNSVARRTINLDAAGFVRHPDAFAIIKVGQAGQPAPPPAPAPPIPPPPAPVPSQSAPPLIRQEQQPPRGSLYVNINLGAINHDQTRVAPMTGIFFPANFNPAAGIDVVLYLHGFKQPQTAIDRLWNRRIHSWFGLREAVNASGRNVVFVAPTLGSRTHAGWLTNAGGLDRYLALVRAALIAYAGSPPYAMIRSVILACHSGGGRPMHQIAASSNRAAGLIRECWGFDSLYNRGDDAFWANWARVRPQNRVFFYYIVGKQTAPLSIRLASYRVPNVSVLPAATPVHNLVPVTHLAQRLMASPLLRNG
jgi:hypothetical protein